MEDNRIVEFSNEDILMEFEIGNQGYAVIKADEDSDDTQVYYVKVDDIDGEKIARSIEDEEELDRVEKAFNDMLEDFELGEE